MEILGNLKGVLGLVEHLYPVQVKYPGLLSYLVVADQIRRSIEEADLIWRHPPFRFILANQGEWIISIDFYMMMQDHYTEYCEEKGTKKGKNGKGAAS